MKPDATATVEPQTQPGAAVAEELQMTNWPTGGWRGSLRKLKIKVDNKLYLLSEMMFIYATQRNHNGVYL